MAEALSQDPAFILQRGMHNGRWRAVATSRLGNHCYYFREAERENETNLLLWVGIGPGLLALHQDARTLTRYRRFSEQQGYAGFALVNLVSLRLGEYGSGVIVRYSETDLRGNDYMLWFEQAIQMHPDVMAAWGSVVAPVLGGSSGEQRIGYEYVQSVLPLLKRARSIRCLGYTANSQPRSVGMVPYTAEVWPWTECPL